MRVLQVTIIFAAVIAGLTRGQGVQSVSEEAKISTSLDDEDANTLVLKTEPIRVNSVNGIGEGTVQEVDLDYEHGVQDGEGYTTPEVVQTDTATTSAAETEEENLTTTMPSDMSNATTTTFSSVEASTTESEIVEEENVGTTQESEMVEEENVGTTQESEIVEEENVGTTPETDTMTSSLASIEAMKTSTVSVQDEMQVKAETTTVTSENSPATTPSFSKGSDEEEGEATEAITEETRTTERTNSEEIVKSTTIAFEEVSDTTSYDNILVPTSTTLQAQNVDSTEDSSSTADNNVEDDMTDATTTIVNSEDMSISTEASTPLSEASTASTIATSSEPSETTSETIIEEESSSSTASQIQEMTTTTDSNQEMQTETTTVFQSETSTIVNEEGSTTAEPSVTSLSSENPTTVAENAIETSTMIQEENESTISDDNDSKLSSSTASEMSTSTNLSYEDETSPAEPTELSEGTTTLNPRTPEQHEDSTDNSEMIHDLSTEVPQKVEDTDFPLNHLPPRPRAFDKIVPSVSEFAKKIRNGKQIEDGILELTTPSQDSKDFNTERLEEIETRTIQETTTTEKQEDLLVEMIMNTDQMEESTTMEALSDSTPSDNVDNIMTSTVPAEATTLPSEDSEKQTTMPIETSSIQEDRMESTSVTEETNMETTTSVEGVFAETTTAQEKMHDDATIAPEEAIVETTIASQEMAEESTTSVKSDITTKDIPIETTSLANEDEANTFSIDADNETVMDTTMTTPDAEKTTTDGKIMGDYESSEATTTESLGESETTEAAPTSTTTESTNEDTVDNETRVEASMVPRITEEPSMIHYFKVGEPFVLVCDAESGASESAIKFTWTKNGRPLKINDAVNQIYSENALNGNLLFISPKMRDVGTYQCAAQNKFGKVFSKASLVMVREDKMMDLAKETSTVSNDLNDVTIVDSREPRRDDKVFVVLPEQPEDNAEIIEMTVVEGEMQ